MSLAWACLARGLCSARFETWCASSFELEPVPLLMSPYPPHSRQVRFLTLGFELELYAACELTGLYWYQDVLCGMQLQLQREVQEKANLQRAQAAKMLAASGDSSSKKGKKDKKPKSPKPVVVGSYATHVDLLFAHVFQELSRGTCLLLAALSRQSLMPPSTSEHMTIPLRFNHRVAPFNVLARPPPLTAAHFEQAFEQVHGLSIDALLSSALSHFKSAKSRLDVPLKADGKVSDAPILSTNQRNEAMALAKVAVANSVLIATLSMKPPAPGVVAQFSFSVHPHFVAVSFKTPNREDGT